MEQRIIENAKTFIKELLGNDAGGHDESHSLRVYETAVRLAESENADVFKTALAALLHDVDDVKLFPDTYRDKKHARAFMASQGIDEATQNEICSIIAMVSFRGTDSTVPDSIEGKCVQDADRLDAIGAIGVGRAFAYGGSRGRKMYDPDVPPKMNMNEAQYRASDSNTINHFYEKLFLLNDMLNTESARRIGERRTKYMREFVEEFILETKGER